MKSTSQVPSRKNGIVGAIGVLILLIGTATGNGYAMLVLSVVALLVLVIFFRPAGSRNARLTVLIAASVGIVAAVVAMMM